MPLPLPISCFIKIQIGYTFLVPAHPGSPGKRAVKCVCVCVCLNTQKLTGLVKVVSVCVCVGNFPSVHRGCSITTVTSYFQLDWVHRHISHVVSTQLLLGDWTVGSLEWLGKFMRLQWTISVTWTLDGASCRLGATLQDVLVTLGFTQTGWHLL